jgi:transposase
MLSLGSATRVYLAVGTTDMRKGFEGLFASVKEQMALDPLSGHVFVFCNRARDRIKVLCFDGSGLWICAKRLEAGRFRWPAANDVGTSIGLSRAELTLLLEGIDLKDGRQRRWYRRETGDAAEKPSGTTHH